MSIQYPTHRIGGLALLQSSKPFEAEKRITLLIRLHFCISMMHAGKSIPQDWADVATVVNVTRLLAEKAKRNPQAALPIVQAAHNAMLSGAENSNAAAALVINAAELRALQALADLYEELLQVISPRQYAQALNAIPKRIQKGDVQKMRAPDFLKKAA